MISINEQIYRSVADALRREIKHKEFFNGTIEYDSDEIHARLTLSCIIHRRICTAPDGQYLAIIDIIPVWWEFATVQQYGEVLNDFSFATLKEFATDHL